jgi:hypothetical protein
MFIKKLLGISILTLIVGCSGSSTSSTKTKGNCYDPNPKGKGHSTYGIPQVWSC